MKKYIYEPMNATEYFLYEIAKSNDEVISLLRKMVESKTKEKEVVKPVKLEAKEKVEEVREAITPTPRKRTTKKG